MTADRNHIDSAAIARIVNEIVGEPAQEVVRIRRGYGNQNWKVICGGRKFLIKVSQLGYPLAKTDSASEAWRRATSAGVKVAKLVAVTPECQHAGGRTVRLFEFLPGHDPRDVLTDSDRVRRFFEGLAEELVRFHSVGCDAFSSRIGGEPSFASWADYVAYRSAQIAQRGQASRLLSTDRLGELLEQARSLARAVAPMVRPALTHRDLYLDNLLANGDGSFAGLLDLDLTEAWDPVADLVKLRWQVFSEFPESERIFRQTRRDLIGDEPGLAERLKLAAIIELTNQAINGELNNQHDYAQSALDRLVTELDQETI